MVTTKELSPDFIHCPRDDLIILIARMLQSLISINDNYNQDSDSISPTNLTRFHSRTPPAISVYSYLARLARYSSLENAVLLAAVYYIDLLSTIYTPFTLNSLTVHRFLLTATTVGSKGLCDSFCTNSHYAKVGGIQANELDILEREFLAKVNYRILPRDYNIENCTNEQKVHSERKKSINPLEPDPQSVVKEDTKISTHEQHKLPNGGYNILDTYFKKLVALVGNQTSIDDPTITEHNEYIISSAFDQAEQVPLIKTEPDTLPDGKYQQLLKVIYLNKDTIQKKKSLDLPIGNVVHSPLKRPVDPESPLPSGKRSSASTK